MHPIELVIMAILAGKLSWLYFQPLSPPRQRIWFLLNFLWFYIVFRNVFAGPFFPALMRTAVLHLGRVSAGQLCDPQSGLMHVSSQTAIYGQSTVVDNAMALRWSHEDCSTRDHSFDTSCYAQSDQISFHYIMPRWPLDRDQPRFVAWHTAITHTVKITMWC